MYPVELLNIERQRQTNKCCVVFEKRCKRPNSDQTALIRIHPAVLQDKLVLRCTAVRTLLQLSIPDSPPHSPDLSWLQPL